MRDMEFRGKRKDNNEWIYGPWIYELSDSLFIRENRAIQGFCVNRSTVGEYIGLKDKNGCKIYEGDVVRGILEGCVQTKEVKYSYCGFDPFCINSYGSYDDFYMELETSVIIGNIHENPELLNV